MKKFAKQMAALLCLLLCVTVAFPMACFANDQTGDSEEQPQAVTESAVPLTPDGQGTVIDNVTEADGKEFFTIMTPDENVFYLIIDRQRDSENVYFLNAVTESDLMALAEKDAEGANTETESAIPEPEPVCTCDEKCAPGEVDTDCPVCVLNLKQCAGKEKQVQDVETETDAEASEQPKRGANAWILILVAVAAGLAGYYFKVYKPKKDLEDAEDIDDLIRDDDTINEDGMGNDANGMDTVPPEVMSAYQKTPVRLDKPPAEEPDNGDEPDYPGDYTDEPDDLEDY